MNGNEASYFRQIDGALKEAGIAWPVMVIDRDRLDANLDALAAVLPPDKAVRVVAKSLPSAELLRHVTGRLQTARLMTFSTEMLKQLHAALPDMQHFFGKPVPVAAVASLLQGDPGLRQLATRVVWLVDTAERIRQYQELAGARGVILKIAVEIDVGLRRGGFDPGRNLRDGLEALAASPALTFAGMMGYEPHLPALPSLLGIRERAERAFRTGYRQALAEAAGVFGEDRCAGFHPQHGRQQDLSPRGRGMISSTTCRSDRCWSSRPVSTRSKGR